MIKIYTIGFTEKSAEKFFDLLKNAEVKKMIDIRLNNSSQLAGFAKGSDLKFFFKEILNVDYEHNLKFAPSKELLTNIRENKINWEEYEKEFLELIAKRNILAKIDFEKLNGICFLCSEHKPENCHRKLLAEYLQKANSEIEITHLV